MMKTTHVGKLVGAAAVIGMLGMVPQQSVAWVVVYGWAGGDFGAGCSLAELGGGGTINIKDTLFLIFSLRLLFGRPVGASVVPVDPIGALYNSAFTLVDTGNTLRALNCD